MRVDVCVDVVVCALLGTQQAWLDYVCCPRVNHWIAFRGFHSLINLFCEHSFCKVGSPRSPGIPL